MIKIYSALGSTDRGATVADILRRCDWAKKDIKNELNQMLEIKLIRKVEDRYFPLKDRIELSDFDLKNVAELGKKVCQQISKSADKIVLDEKSWMYYSTFSVASHQRAELKTKMREAVMAVLEEFQVEDGDHVEQLFLTMY